jgi:DNA-binding NarL/FixJ family response regulator
LLGFAPTIDQITSRDYNKAPHNNGEEIGERQAMSLKIFIVEDHPLMRQTLTEFINGKPGLEVVGLAATGGEALERLAEAAVDIVIVDVRLDGKNGIQLVEQLRERYPGLQCLMLSGYGEAVHIRHAFKAGARGYILKGKPPEILEAIETVAVGGTYLSPALQEKWSGADDWGGGDGKGS